MADPLEVRITARTVLGQQVTNDQTVAHCQQGSKRKVKHTVIKGFMVDNARYQPAPIRAMRYLARLG